MNLSHAEVCARGGRARAKKLSRARRKAIASKAAVTRWAKHNKAKKQAA